MAYQAWNDNTHAAPILRARAAVARQQMHVQRTLVQRGVPLGVARAYVRGQSGLGAYASADYDGLGFSLKKTLKKVGKVVKKIALPVAAVALTAVTAGAAAPLLLSAGKLAVKGASAAFKLGGKGEKAVVAAGRAVLQKNATKQLSDGVRASEARRTKQNAEDRAAGRYVREGGGTTSAADIAQAAASGFLPAGAGSGGSGGGYPAPSVDATQASTGSDLPKYAIPLAIGAGLFLMTRRS